LPEKQEPRCARPAVVYAEKQVADTAQSGSAAA